MSERWPRLRACRRRCGGLASGLVLLSSCAPEGYVIPLPGSDGASTTELASTGTLGADGTSTGSTTAQAETTDATDTGTGATCLPLEDAEDWWNAAWRRRQRLEVDVSAFSGSGTLTDFPLLLRVSVDALGASWSERGGADLRFLSEDQSVELAYDVDDVDDGDLLVWLRIPELDPRQGTLALWMYHDEPEAEPGAAPASVWSGFISVHHLGADLLDSTGDHHGSSPSEPVICEGSCGARIGRARSFDPLLLQEVVLDGHEAYDLGADPYASTISFTVSVWMRSTSFALHPWGGLVAKGDAWRIHVMESPNRLYDDRVSFAFDCNRPSCAGIVEPFGHYNLVASSARVNDNVNDGAWHQVVATFEAVDIPVVVPPRYVPDVRARIYVDGQQVAATPVLPQVLIDENDQPVRFGHNINGVAPRRYEGDLDEIRISADARSPEEIAADHVTVTRDDLVTADQEQVLCP